MAATRPLFRGHEFVPVVIDQSEPALCQTKLATTPPRAREKKCLSTSRVE